MNGNPHLAVVNAFVEQISLAGVHHVCVSPGSRSTPFTVAFARHSKITLWMLPDERSAAYFALGLAKARKTAVALVCTSGTATANYLPALMEAHYSRVPLLVLTADRPPELRHVGSNQTVIQTQLYEPYVKWSQEMPVPDATAALLAHARATACRAVAIASCSPQGPVHLNWPFREPLMPPREDAAHSEVAAATATVTVTVREGKRQLPDPAIAEIAEVLTMSDRVVLVCGPCEDQATAAAISRFAAILQCPVLADPLSQLRSLASDPDLIIDRYDTFLRSGDPGVAALRPTVVIRFGQTPTSKVLNQWLGECQGARQFVIDDAPAWRDPFFTATDVLVAEPGATCDALCGQMGQMGRSAFCARWLALNAATDHKLAEWLESQPTYAMEGKIVADLADLLPANAVLFVGNSMPVRDLDAFFPKRARALRLFANRGASGIDGVVSTALGVSAGSAEPCVLVIGDLSFYHDCNGLLASSKYSLHLIVILIHNDGGGIFSFLPPAAEPDVFEHFATPHGLDFAPVVAMYGGVHIQIADVAQFRRAFSEAVSGKGLHVLEIRTDREENVRLHREVLQYAVPVADAP